MPRPVFSPFQPAIDKILALNTRGGRVDVRGILAYAGRLEERAQRAAWRGEDHEAATLRHLAYVHRAAAVQVEARPARRWWRRGA